MAFPATRESGRHGGPSRKGLVTGALLLVASLIALPATAAPASPGRVEFEVLRNGQPFGKQSVVVSEANGELVAESQADLKADFGPITVFHYQQTCRETWGNSGLADLSCSTNKNGQKTKVEGTREAGSLQVSAGKKQIDFPLGSLPSAWWTKPPVATYDMINTETGQRMPVRVTHIGRETIDTGKGRVEAEHIRVSGTLTVDLWYDDAGHWVSCAFSMSGQKMTYRLLTSIAEGPA